MAKNFSNVMDYKVVANNVVKMFNNVDDVVDYVVMMMKKHPNNAVYVNDMGIRLEKELDGKIGVALRDSEFNLIRGYVMGKIKRGMDKAVAYVMESVNNNMEENNMNDMANSVEMFNEFIKDMLLNEYNDVVNSADNFAHDYGDECVDDEYVCGRMIYDYDIRKMWADWCWKNDVMNHNDAYKYYDDNNDMFICEDTLDDIVEGLDGTDDVGYGECLVWVVNPFYVEQDMVKNDAPCLVKVCPNFDKMVNGEDVESGFGDDFWDEDDIKRVADTIENYLKNYTPSFLDKFGDCVISIYWDNFNEEDYNMLVEDKIFAKYVEDILRERGIIKNSWDFLVDDENDTVDVTVDYNKMFNNVA